MSGPSTGIEGEDSKRPDEAFGTNGNFPGERMACATCSLGGKSGREWAFPRLRRLDFGIGHPVRLFHQILQMNPKPACVP